MTKQAWILIGLGSLLALPFFFFITLGYRVTAGRAQVGSAVPARPAIDLKWSAEFRKRLDQSERDARNGSATALGELSRLYHANGFSSEAMECYQGLGRADPTNPRWPHLRATLLADYGRLDEALPSAQRTVLLAPNYLPARLLLARIYLKSGREAEAQKEYQATLDQEKDNVYALEGLALVDVAYNSWTAARDHLRQAVAIRPQFTEAQTMLVGVYEHLGDAAAANSARVLAGTDGRFPDAPDAWKENLMDDCYDAYRLSVLAAAAGAAGNGATAKRWLERAVDLAPEQAWTHRLLGQLLDQLHDYPAAHPQLQRALELDSAEPSNWSQLAWLQRHEGDAPGAEKTLVAGLAHCPEDGNLHYEHGSLLIDLGQLDAARDELREARRLNPNRSAISFDLARIYFQTGHDAEGVAELNATLALEPEHAFALLTLARNAVRIGDEPAARAWVERVRRQPRVPADAVERLLAGFEQRFGHPPAQE